MAQVVERYWLEKYCFLRYYISGISVEDLTLSMMKTLVRLRVMRRRKARVRSPR